MHFERHQCLLDRAPASEDKLDLSGGLRAPCAGGPDVLGADRSGEAGDLLDGRHRPERSDQVPQQRQ
jgi:hypothetical protein